MPTKEKTEKAVRVTLSITDYVNAVLFHATVCREKLIDVPRIDAANYKIRECKMKMIEAIESLID